MAKQSNPTASSVLDALNSEEEIYQAKIMNLNTIIQAIVRLLRKGRIRRSNRTGQTVNKDPVVHPPYLVC